MPAPPRPPRPVRTELQRSSQEIETRFRSMADGRDVADLLEIEPSHLHYITSRRRERYRYREFEIPKKDGRPRKILAPHRTVKILQRKLLHALNLVYDAHPAAHGFVPGRSILTNAQPHQSKRFVLNADLEDFFPSITFPRVRGLFIKRFRLPDRAATVLARICCNTDDDPDHLPQGAPTSPIISNMICHSMDHALVGLARDHGLFYTRYADDLTFSTNRRPFPQAVAVEHDGRLLTLGAALVRVAEEENGFTLNARKSRLFSKARRQEVTGLTVNRRVNTPRALIHELRGVLHAWRAHGYEDAEQEYRKRSGGEGSLRRFVQGKLAFLKQIRGVDDSIFRRLYGWARDLERDSFAELPPLAPADSLQAAAAEYPSITNSDPLELRKDYLSRMFASADGTLWIVDPNLRIGPLRVLADSLEHSRVREIRMLSRDAPEGARLEQFRSLAAEVVATGRRLEWRISQERLFHDRWLADDSTCISIGGPFDNIASHENPPYGQNIVSRRPDQLNRWWSQSAPLA